MAKIALVFFIIYSIHTICATEQSQNVSTPDATTKTRVASTTNDADDTYSSTTKSSMSSAKSTNKKIINAHVARTKHDVDDTYSPTTDLILSAKSINEKKKKYKRDDEETDITTANSVVETTENMPMINTTAIQIETSSLGGSNSTSTGYYGKSSSNFVTILLISLFSLIFFLK